MQPQSYKTDLFNGLQFAKQDIQHLGTRDLLRKDFKSWIIPSKIQLGISSVNWNFKEWIEKETCRELWFTQVQNYAQESKSDLFCIMTASTKNQVFYRELLVYVCNREKVKNTTGFYSALLASDLGLKVMHQTDDYIIYQQENSKASRKQVQPILVDILEKNIASSL